MLNFQFGVLIIATVVLIITLSIIAISFSNIKNDSKYPPVVSDCPDYWIVMSDTSGNKCMNTHADLGNSSCPKIKDFSGPLWLGELGMCAKKTWATSCNLTWDGVTNARKNPCSKQ
jgi:hypothetical protein